MAEMNLLTDSREYSREGENIMELFLAINKDYLGLGLKSIDLLLISQIEEFERNKCQCYVTNKQFSEMFGESESTIKRALDKLDDLNIIKRDTTFIEGNGRANRQRVLSMNSRREWKVQNEPTNIMEGSNIRMEGSNVDNGRFKNEEWKVHNEPIKDNIKYNIKDNIKDNINISAPQPEPIKKEYDNYIIPYKDGGATFYNTNDFNIDDSNKEYYYKEFINPAGSYKFDKSFVQDWFKEKYGYIHEEEEEYLPSDDWDGNYPFA